MKKLIAELKRKKDAAEQAIRDANQTILATSTAIKAIQDICTHATEDGADALAYIGHDSHKDHYECLICGAKVYV